MANSDETQGWLCCECDVCKHLDAIAHDIPAWHALLDEKGMQCPAYARSRNPDPWRVDTQLTCNGDCGGCEACDRTLGLAPMSEDRQLTIEGVTR